MQRIFVPINEQGMELMEYDTNDFPCSVLFSDVAKYTNKNIPWHWHEEIEIFLVTKGCFRMRLGGKEYIIPESNGAFINTNALHSMDIAGGDSCEVITILFSPAIFTGGKDTSVYDEVTSPVYKNQGLTTKLFSRSSSWENEILSCIKTIYSAYEENDFTKKLIICEKLAHIWQLILNYSLQKELKNVVFNPQQENRTQIMMQFIHENYSEQLSINDIANSAGISIRECSRCFKNIIHIPPVKYLMKFRISVSVSLLLRTNHSITEISSMVGFNSSSYFTKVFKEYMHMSPISYKKLHKLKKDS